LQRLQGFVCGDDETATFFIYFNLVLSTLTLEEFKEEGFGPFSVKLSKIWLSKTGNQTENQTENEYNLF